MNVFKKTVYISLLIEVSENLELLPEMGSQEYSNHLDALIHELANFKKSLRKGPDRHKNRKEISNLQRAIESLRYFNRKNKKILDS